MQTGPRDPRDIPILTDAVRQPAPQSSAFDITAVHAAILSETLQLADSLLHQAAKDIEATLFERVFDRLRARLPELVDRVLREHSSAPAASAALAPAAAAPAPQEPPEDHG